MLREHSQDAHRIEWGKITCGSTPTSKPGARQRPARNDPEATDSARAMEAQRLCQGQSSEISGQS